MSISPRLSLVAALMLSVAGSPALADLTVDDAWNVWKSQIGALGLTIDAEEARDGDALQIGPINMSFNLPMEAGVFTGSFPGPRFEPLGDGTVRVSYPEESQFVFGGEIEGEASMNVVVDATLEGQDMVMSGIPDRVVSTGGYDAVRMRLADLTIDGEKLGQAEGTMTVLGGQYELTSTLGGDLITIDGTNAYDRYDLSYGFEIGEDEAQTGVAVSGFAEDVKMTQRIALPAAGLDLLNLHTQLREGMTMSVLAHSARYGSSEETTQNGEVLALQKSEINDYDVSFVLDTKGLSSEIGTGPFTGDIQIAELPFPISLASTKGAGRFVVPLLSTGAPQPGQVMMDMQGLTLNEDLWALADPEGQLPRDPIALRFDLTGEVDVTFDLLDINRLIEGGAPNPFVPVSANLKGLFLSMVGAELTGDGAFTFDAEDTETFPGLPRPEGTLDLNLTGANALIDRLVAMGLIPEEQAMGARMMMGMFAVPGEGEDTLTSQIEINEQGHVLANGQRLR
ncbi:DUF2125 domain-containing protein [uncultured Roseovarius sp.]|uniref:DUF2125 domain-containing protein n=1 Tax=uncultured Roseovarius sp. TaxID=293344 RepID=UPI0026283DDF|nr:DUF2125 domain-containing protein [uncultured Roseovarius sp.]